jgi:hypothetical protein
MNKKTPILFAEVILLHKTENHFIYGVGMLLDIMKKRNEELHLTTIDLLIETKASEVEGRTMLYIKWSALPIEDKDA